jgi:hypothetical protein
MVSPGNFRRNCNSGNPNMHAPVPAEYTAPWIIAGERAIDVPKVRDAIKAIMEGGEAAFNLRKKKYGF